MNGGSNSPEWRKAGAALLGRVGAGAVEGRVRELMEDETGLRILVACSGGADSVFLLCLLGEWAGRFEMELEVAHYNHGWRGAESAGDASFVAQAAEAMGLRFHAGGCPPEDAARSETAARRQRLAFLREAAEAARCPWIAFGHQRDDILETQLQRLARGAGTEGLAAPRPIHRFPGGRPGHLRPLLDWPAGEIRRHLAECGIPWREDRSNRDAGIARNALRETVIPGLGKAVGRDPGTGAARSRALLEEDAAALDEWARDSCPAAFAGESRLDARELADLPKALVRRVLNAWLGNLGLRASVGARGMDQLVAAVHSSVPGLREGEFSIGVGEGFVRMRAGAVYWEAAAENEAGGLPENGLRLAPGVPVRVGGDGVLAMDACDADGELRRAILEKRVDPEREAYVDAGRTGVLWVRQWRAADRFRPLGAPGSRKLQDWFTDRKVPRRERKRLPVVVSEAGELVWVPGFPPADAVKVRPETDKALRLTYHKSATA